MERSRKQFEIVRSREVAEVPDFEVRMFGEELNSDISDSQKDQIFSLFRQTLLERDLTSPDLKNLLDYALPGEIMRSEGMPQDLSRLGRFDYKMRALDQLTLPGEQSDIKLERLLRKRLEYARDHFEMVQERLSQNRDVIDSTVVEVLGGRLGGDIPGFRELLASRIDTIERLVIIDPLLYPDMDINGDFSEDGGVRTIRVNGFANAPEMTYIHELLHALQTDFTVIETDVKEEDEFGQHFGGDVIDPDQIRSIRTGLDMRRWKLGDPGEPGVRRTAFRALNEAVTENLTRFLAPTVQERIPDIKINKDLAYLVERDQLGIVIDLIAERFGVSQAEELRDLFYLAAFADDVNAEKGRAYYLRALSKKLRNYFGKGALVALDKVMEEFVDRASEHSNPEGSPSLEEEFTSFLESRLTHPS